MKTFASFILCASMIQIAAAQSATLNDIMFEHQAKEDGVAGLKIYLDMDVKNLKGKTGMVAIYFYDSEHNPLPDRNGKYRTTSGQVAHSRTFTPSYDSSHYKNFTLFMPNDELDYLSTQGRSETIYCQIEVSQNSRLLASSKSQPMHISVVNSHMTRHHLLACSALAVASATYAKVVARWLQGFIINNSLHVVNVKGVASVPIVRVQE